MDLASSSATPTPTWPRWLTEAGATCRPKTSTPAHGDSWHSYRDSARHTSERPSMWDWYDSPHHYICIYDIDPIPDQFQIYASRPRTQMFTGVQENTMVFWKMVFAGWGVGQVTIHSSSRVPKIHIGVRFLICHLGSKHTIEKLCETSAHREPCLDWEAQLARSWAFRWSVHEVKPISIVLFKRALRSPTFIPLARHTDHTTHLLLVIYQVNWLINFSHQYFDKSIVILIQITTTTQGDQHPVEHTRHGNVIYILQYIRLLCNLL